MVSEAQSVCSANFVISVGVIKMKYFQYRLTNKRIGIQYLIMMQTQKLQLKKSFTLHSIFFPLFGIPQIALSYLPACLMLLNLVATSPPAVSLHADRCILQITGCVDVFAVLPNSTTQYIFTGNLVSNMSQKITFSAGS